MKKNWNFKIDLNFKVNQKKPNWEISKIYLKKNWKSEKERDRERERERGNIVEEVFFNYQITERAQVAGAVGGRFK